jgi:hypothetical protein
VTLVALSALTGIAIWLGGLDGVDRLLSQWTVGVQ